MGSGETTKACEIKVPVKEMNIRLRKRVEDIIVLIVMLKQQVGC